MGVLKLEVSVGKSDDTLERDYERSVSSKYADVQACVDLIQSVLSGNQKGPEAGSPPQVDVSVEGNAVRASQTLTMTSVIATDAISINNVSFTAVASGAGANQFNVGVTDAATAANLAASINASVTALVAGYVTAAVTSTASSPAVVTVYSTNYGIFGNQTLIASADGTIVAGGARLVSGAVDASAKSYTF